MIGLLFYDQRKTTLTNNIKLVSTASPRGGFLLPAIHKTPQKPTEL